MLLICGLVTGTSASPPAYVHSSPMPAISVPAPSVGNGLRDRTHALHVVTPRPPAMVAVPEWRLLIAKIGVDARIEPVGLDPKNDMTAPSGLDDVGWYDDGPLPGKIGDAVIAGHYGLPSDPAVFRDLGLLRPGDSIQVIWPDGHSLQFRVTSRTLVSADASPPSDVFSRLGSARLSLITCAGAWEQSRRTYSQRLIVTAELAS